MQMKIRGQAFNPSPSRERSAEGRVRVILALSIADGRRQAIACQWPGSCLPWPCYAPDPFAGRNLSMTRPSAAVNRVNWNFPQRIEA